MQNPWLGFAHSQKMLHPLDLEAVEYHNSNSKPDYQFLLHLAPEPWIGNIHGNLFVLYSNPGATKDNLNKIFQKSHKIVIEKSIKNLNQKNKDYPHFHFDPELEGSEGFNWFHKKYKWLVDATDSKAVSNNLVTCELAPYHSMKWKIPKYELKTQLFTYHIIKEAIKRNAVILLARTPRLWIKNIPELETYRNVFRPNSINASISPNNYPGNFDKILNALK